MRRCAALQVEFENNIVGTAIPAGYIPACEKGFREACHSGALIGYPVEVRALATSPLGCKSSLAQVVYPPHPTAMLADSDGGRPTRL